MNAEKCNNFGLPLIYFGCSLITGKSKTIKVVLPDIHNPVFVNTLDSVESHHHISSKISLPQAVLTKAKPAL